MKVVSNGMLGQCSKNLLLLSVESKGISHNGIKIRELKLQVMFKILIEFSLKQQQQQNTYLFILAFKLLLTCLVNFR